MTVGIEGADIEERPAGHRRAALVALSVGGFGIGLTEFVIAGLGGFAWRRSPPASDRSGQAPCRAGTAGKPDGRRPRPVEDSSA